MARDSGPRTMAIMNNIKIRTYDIMIFVVLAAIAFSLNDVYLAVEFSGRVPKLLQVI